jgi:cytochrome bd ubiquinol oxidase subunit I
MTRVADIHRLQFAFTATFHYIFPQLTMGLALLLLILKTAALRTGNEHYNRALRFWAKIFAISFAIGVVTGIPLEFEFGTNWAVFSRTAGGVIGQTLAMEGIFSFFLESSVLGLVLYGERRLGQVGHWVAVFLVWLGSWLSGYFIVVTNAWMQHPTGFSAAPDGQISLQSFWALLLNPWARWEYTHTMLGAVQTGCIVMATVGAFYLLSGRDATYGRTFVRTGVMVGVVAAVLQLFPSGDIQGRMIAQYQPTTLAAMEGLFHSQAGAPLVILGQPDVEQQHIDNPLIIPRALSFLTYRRWKAAVAGLDQFPRANWPDRIPLLYYSYHIMVGLGTIFIVLLIVAAWMLWRGTLFSSRRMLWLLLLALPFPFIANTAGWFTAELGRQPWIIYGLQRTSAGVSPMVSSGNVWFTFVGFTGMYAALGALFLLLVYREIEHGPESGHEAKAHPTGAEPSR